MLGRIHFSSYRYGPELNIKYVWQIPLINYYLDVDWKCFYDFYEFVYRASFFVSDLKKLDGNCTVDIRPSSN